MSRTVVHLLRHGEVHNPDGILYGRLPGFVLSATGREMAAAAAQALAGHDVTYLVASPLDRAQETARAIAAQFDLAVATDPRLIESDNIFEGRRFGLGDGVLRRPSVWLKMRNPFTPSWGEPYREIGQRMYAALLAARGAADGHEAVCVSHQLPIETVRRQLLGRRLWHHPGHRRCGLASLTSVTFDGETVVDVAYQEPAAHLVPATPAHEAGGG
ncbi:MAG: histidine phosphatase family protein [Actinomycetota bacterium]|nr:histidine phosphatase family protein [Actinomycetota bacterium]